MRRTLVLTMMLALGGCTGETDTDLEESEDIAEAGQSIINGTTDNVHLAVGELLLGGTQGGRCTGTAIGPRWVLTAAHCVTGMTPGDITFVRWGSTAIQPIERWEFAVDQIQSHPDFDGQTSNNDVALLRLAENVNTTPMPLTYAAPALNNALTLVGFGYDSTNNTGNGVRRSAVNAVDVLTNLTYDYNGSSGGEGNICPGDSGGPSLRQVNGVEAVAGVHSRVSTTCGAWGRSARADVKAGWVVTHAGLGVTTVGWRNPREYRDVNGDGYIAPIDALIVINYLNSGSPSLLSAQRPAGSNFLDVNGDGSVAPIDALIIINYLNGY